MTKTDLPATKKRRFRWRLDIVLWSAFILLVVYPLSVGPAALILSKTGTRSQTVEKFYTPLEWISGHYRPLEHFLDWYGKLWGM